jgi:hypothetical protein
MTANSWQTESKSSETLYISLESTSALLIRSTEQITCLSRQYNHASGGFLKTNQFRQAGDRIMFESISFI